MLPLPRSRICLPWPASALPPVTATPTAAPCRKSDRVGGRSVTSSISSRATVLPTSRPRRMPASLVTTISSIATGSGVSAKSTIAARSAGTLTDRRRGRYPMSSTRRTWSPTGTAMSMNRPSSPERTASAVPSRINCAPGSAACDWMSLTLPMTVPVWAQRPGTKLAARSSAEAVELMERERFTRRPARNWRGRHAASARASRHSRRSPTPSRRSRVWCPRPFRRTRWR